MASTKELASAGAAILAIPAGALVVWGGISGNLAAILAAFFAPSQLQKVQGLKGVDIPPPFLVPPNEQPTINLPGSGNAIPSKPSYWQRLWDNIIGKGSPGSTPLPGTPIPPSIGSGGGQPAIGPGEGPLPALGP